jgi:hypothetical protein
MNKKEGKRILEGKSVVRGKICLCRGKIKVKMRA